MEKTIIDALKKRKSKHNNIKNVIDGIEFDSIAEANRYKELKLLEKAGEIRGLVIRPRFTLISEENGEYYTYFADFGYFDKENYCISENVKKHKLKNFKIKN